MKTIAPYQRVFLLSLWLLCGLTVVGLQSGRYFLEPVTVAAELPTAHHDAPETEEPGEQEHDYAQITIASEALLPILKNLPQPVIFQIMEMVVIEEINLPVPVAQPVTQTGFLKVLFRQIISPNAP